MKKNEKILIMVLILITIAVIVVAKVVGGNKKQDGGNEVQQGQNQQEEEYTTKLEDGTKVNVSEEFKSKKVYGELEITNIQFTEKNGMSVLLADVTNTGSTTHKPEIVLITILGANGEEITQIKPVIGEIEPGKTIKLNASVTADVANAKDFKIEAKNNSNGNGKIWFP